MLEVKFRKDIAPIALPIFLSLVVFQIQTMINRAFLGRLNIEYLSVISNVVFPMWTTVAMLNALATGATILMSQSLGAGDRGKARMLAAAALKGNGIAALILFVFWFTSSGIVFRLMGVTGNILEYCVRYSRIASFSFLISGVSSAMTAVFQASGRTRPLMYSGALRSLLNILLDWLLIFGSLGFPALGYEGAAAATVIADFAGVIFLGALLMGDKRIEARPDFRSVLRAPIRDYRHIVKMGVPTSLEDMLWNVGNLMLIRFLNRLDPLAVAVYSLVFTMEILPIVVFAALGQTTTVLVGKAKGAGSFIRAKGAAVTALAAAWIVSALIAAVFASVPAGLVAVFTGDSSVISRAAAILLVSCFTFFPRSVNFMAGSGIRGLGNTTWMLGTQVFGTVFIVALGWLLIFQAGLGVMGLFIAMLADEGVRSVANSIRFLRGVNRSARAAAAAEEQAA
jgi:MATE family multidrug resistance protein